MNASLLRRAGLLAATLATAGAGQAACVINNPTADLGTVASQRVATGALLTTQASFVFAFTGATLNVLGGTPSLGATLQPVMTGLTLKDGRGNSIPYQVTGASGAAYTGGLLELGLNATTVLGVLQGSGAIVQMNLAMVPGANVPAGRYTDTIQLTWTPRYICDGLLNLVGLLCLGTYYNAPEIRYLTVSLTVRNDCVITAPNVNFGSAPLVAAFPTVSQSISLRCSKGMSYTVGMTAGANASGGRRQMAPGAAARLAYDIFKPDNTVWGDTGTARANGPGPADGTSTQIIPYTARIYPEPVTPPAGVYTDSVTVNVEF